MLNAEALTIKVHPGYITRKARASNILWWPQIEFDPSWPWDKSYADNATKSDWHPVFANHITQTMNLQEHTKISIHTYTHTHTMLLMWSFDCKNCPKEGCQRQSKRRQKLCSQPTMPYSDIINCHILLVGLQFNACQPKSYFIGCNFLKQPWTVLE